MDRTALSQERFPFPHDPKGWFCVGLSKELAPGRIESRAFMGREVVLFRTASGVPALMDAYCPHMGAHMGKGGEICGESIRCPFHYFEFEPKGTCVATPYGGPAPRSARARTWPVVEKNGLLFAWHHPEESPPEFELPELPTAGFEGPMSHAWSLRTHPQEISENSVDVGHFGVVHRYTDVEERAPLRVEQFVLHISYAFRRAVDVLGLRLGSIRTDFDGEVHGLGYSYVNSLVKNLGVRSLHLVLPTPTRTGETELRIVLWTRLESASSGFMRWIPKILASPLTMYFAFVGYRHDVSQDISVWENKIYLHPPALAKGDGPIGRYRAWCRQFYPQSPGTPAVEGSEMAAR